MQDAKPLDEQKDPVQNDSPLNPAGDEQAETGTPEDNPTEEKPTEEKPTEEKPASTPYDFRNPAG